jgi:hypothetical protein
MSARTVPSMSTLERTYDRMPRFLRAIAFYPVIAGALARRGLTREIVQDGWNRFFRATGIDRLPPVVGGSGPRRRRHPRARRLGRGRLSAGGCGLQARIPHSISST